MFVQSYWSEDYTIADRAKMKGITIIILCALYYNVFSFWLWRLILQGGWDLMLSKLVCFC